MIVGNPIPFEARSKLRIPLVSAKVQAGFPSPADDHMERALDLNEHLVANPAATFFVRVHAKGQSRVQRVSPAYCHIQVHFFASFRCVSRNETDGRR